MSALSTSLVACVNVNTYLADLYMFQSNGEQKAVLSAAAKTKK